MDLITLLYYGTVCGVLGLVSPAISGRMIRFGIGVGVGLVAAVTLPAIRASIGV